MTLFATVGHAQALDGREAGLQATHQALNYLGSATPAIGFVFASQQYEASQVVNGISSLLSDVPLIGLSTPAGLTQDGHHQHSVVVALVGGSEISAKAHWLSGYAQSGRETAAQLLKIVNEDKRAKGCALFFADGFNGDAEQLCAAISENRLPVAGGLSSGDLHTGNTYQIGGAQQGSGSLAAAVIKGNIRMGVGHAHGWDPVGSQFRVTRSRGFWIRTLDGRPVSESYAQLFGFPARDWAFPPLSHMARLYPLGIEQTEGLVVRSPIRIEADGSFRMNAPVRDGADAFLLVGSRTGCQKAAQQAAQQALANLNGAKPAFALILADMAWHMLLKDQPGLEVGAVKDVLGRKVPIAGGYTLGQIVPDKNGLSPRFLNQHIAVIAFGEVEEE